MTTDDPDELPDLHLREHKLYSSRALCGETPGRIWTTDVYSFAECPACIALADQLIAADEANERNSELIGV